MPHANPADAFVWRSSIGPRRIRLAGALAIAVSCGGLGVLAGRWSLQVGTAEPGTRTAALIAAVSEETRAKPTSPSSAADGGAAAAPSSLTEAVAQPPRAGPTLLARPQLAPPQPEHAQAADKPDAVTAASPTPVGGAAAAASAATTGGGRRGAPPSRATPTAPNYQALRDYALSR